jgi:hypothetical protein
VFTSERARAAALDDELLDPARASVVEPGRERDLIEVYDATCDVPASSARVLGVVFGPGTE